MRIGTALGLAAAAAVCGIGGSIAARAADMPAYDAPPSGYATPDQQLTFGSGWYLRGDASFGPEDKPKLVLDEAGPSFDRKSSAFGYGFGLGAGYIFNGTFRADVTADYLDPFHYSANTSCGVGCAFNQRTDIERFDTLVNGYVDLGTWAGVTPYVGAGAGLSGTFTDGSVRINGAPLTVGILDPRTGTLVTSGIPSRADYRFAWAAMAGVSYAITPHMLVDLGYRYIDLGRTTVTLFPSTSVSRDLSASQVRLGVRYVVD